MTDANPSTAAENAAEQYIAAAIDRGSGCARRLGKYLADHLDDDNFGPADRMLLGLVEQMNAAVERAEKAEAEVARLREALAAIVARSETGELGTSRTRDMAHLARAALAETADTPAVQPDPTPDPTVGSDYACDHQQPEDHWPPAAYASPGLRARLDC